MVKMFSVNIQCAIEAAMRYRITTTIQQHCDEQHGQCSVYGRPHIGANGVSCPLEKWMKN